MGTLAPTAPAGPAQDRDRGGKSLRRLVPGLGVIVSYRREWLAKDLIAGVVLTTLLVPQGMAYAELAGLPPITGLYTSIMCLLGYAVFGPSRILVLGPDSSLGPMIAATILPLIAADGDPQRAVALASMLAIMVAAILLVAAVARLGFIADLISKPTMIGYMNGLALTILVGQLPKLFGFKVDAGGFLGELAGFIKGLAHGETVPAAAAVGIAGIALILALQRWMRKVPAVLVMVVAAIAATTVFGLADHGVSLVGVLPKGFPPLTIPQVRLDDLGPLCAGALGIALVSLADTISTASAFAARSGQEVHGNGEMMGIGAANLAAGLFQGFAVSTSASRTAVAERSGAKTQLTGVTGAALIIVMIVLLPGLFRNLPSPALAAVVITASLSLADIPAVARLWQQRKAEFLLSVAAFLGVVLLGVLPGIAIAVALSILNVFRRAWWPYDTRLGRVEGIEGYHDVHTHPEAQQLPGLAIYRFDAPLFFANAKTFRDQVRRLARSDPPPTWIIIAAEPVTDVDTTASDVLEELDQALNAQGISLVFAELKDPVRRKIERYGLTRTIEPRHFFPTVETAVAAFRARTDAQWTPARLASADGTAPGQGVADDTASPDRPQALSGPQGPDPESPRLSEVSDMAKKKDKRDRHGTADQAPSPATENDAGAGSHPRMKRKPYEREMRMLHGELVAMQEWVKASGAKVCIVFEGRDTAGKGGTIKRITERVSPRVFRVVALPAPTEREKSQMYVQRYVQHFPAAGEVVIFDRSWYNRAGVERVMGFCSPEETDRFLEVVPAWEKAMTDSGILLLKYWLEVSPDEQTRRLESRIHDPRKIWKLSPMDLKSYSRWYDYSRVRDAMFAATDTAWAPWYVADADDKKRARLNIISHLLSQVPYKPFPQRDIKLPKRQPSGGYTPPNLPLRHIPTPF